MNSFQIALINVLITLFYILPGFLLRKMNKASSEHLPTLSAVLVYIGTPFLLLKAFMRLEFSWEMLASMGWFFIVTLVTQALFMLLLFLLFKKQVQNKKFRVMTIGSVAGNVGFFGMPILTSLYPSRPEIACYSAIFMLTMNILIFTVGVFCLTGDRKYMSLKAALINPTALGFVIALPVYVFGLGKYFPTVLADACSTIGSMTTPLCMFILGIRLASAPLKRIFSSLYVYATAALKLLIFPLFCYACVYFLPFSDIFKAATLILSGMPCAAVLLSLAEMHESEMEMSANCLLVSTVLSFLTIPLLTLFL